MPKNAKCLGLLASIVAAMCASTSWSHAQLVEPTMPPDPPRFDAQGGAEFCWRQGHVRAPRRCPNTIEPAWVMEMPWSKTGKLPPVAERLPVEPLVYKTSVICLMA
jgi:peptide/nickel transport system substrate-binding protein